MKILIWIHESDVQRLNRGESVEYFEREPGIYEHTIQVSIDSDTYQQLKDKKNDRQHTT